MSVVFKSLLTSFCIIPSFWIAFYYSNSSFWGNEQFFTGLVIQLLLSFCSFIYILYNHTA